VRGGIDVQRKRLYLILIGFIIIVIGLNVFWLIKFKQSPVKAGMMPNTSSQITNNKEKQRILNIPPVLKPDSTDANNVYYTLRAQTGMTQLVSGEKTKTYGYNGPFLGPTIRVERGQNIHIHTQNRLKQATSFHWHGAILDDSSDGGPHQTVAAGQNKLISFKVNQPAATLWYHPHAVGSTASQVYNGLAGFLLVDDQNSRQLKLPRNYGKDDFPIVVQDRSFDKNNQLDYKKIVSSNGTLGNTLLINGTQNPYIETTTKYVRLRLLNGSNAREYTFKLDDRSSFYQISTDGGFLKKPVQENKITLAPGERAEIVVDLGHYSQGSQVKLKSADSNILTMKVKNNHDGETKLPRQLTNLQTVTKSGQKVTQNIALSDMGHMVSINNRQFSMNRIDLKVKQNTTQVWKIRNKNNMMGEIHPFHIHGVQFRLLSINNNASPSNMQGWKDTIMTRPGNQYKILIKFTQTGVFMYHCHNLEHEEAGMMGQIRVVP